MCYLPIVLFYVSLNQVSSTVQAFHVKTMVRVSQMSTDTIASVHQDMLAPAVKEVRRVHDKTVIA